MRWTSGLRARGSCDGPKSAKILCCRSERPAGGGALAASWGCMIVREGFGAAGRLVDRRRMLLTAAAAAAGGAACLSGGAVARRARAQEDDTRFFRIGT